MNKKLKNIIAMKGKSINTKKMERSLSWMKHLIDERKRSKYDGK